MHKNRNTEKWIQVSASGYEVPSYNYHFLMSKIIPLRLSLQNANITDYLSLTPYVQCIWKPFGSYLKIYPKSNSLSLPP